jgi:hypothetical protein
MHIDDEAENGRAPIAVTVTEACRLSGFGPTTVWKLIQNGRLKVKRIPGIKRTVVLYPSLVELLAPAASENTKTPPPRRGRGRPRKAEQAGAAA